MSVRAHWLAAVRRGLRAFAHSERGNIAVTFALVIPAVGLLSLGAIDLYGVQSSRTKLQDVANAAALAGANELGLAVGDKVAIERAEAFVAANVASWKRPPSIIQDITVTTEKEQRIIQVILNGHSPSFFGNLLPPGGWKYKAEARAVTVGRTPLCVLISHDSGDKILNVKDASRLAAPQCLVHSNRDILVEGGSISANQVQAVTSASGVISPTPGTGGAPISDPFANLDLKEPAFCLRGRVAKLDVTTGTHRLSAGVHCGQYQIGGNATLILEPGDHWFAQGKLEIKEDGRLQGTDVVLLFDQATQFTFSDRATVNLDGRKTGAFAGMVMAASRRNGKDFIISSDNVETLLGVIYVPNAQLIVEGTRNEIARDSAWTVIVARSLQMKGSPSLFINANYAASDVPVPPGVGPRDAGSRLID